MPMNLANLHAQKATTTITIGGESLTVEYHPHLVSQAAVDECNTNDELFEYTTKIITAWDMYEDDVTPMPPTLENIKRIPRDVLQEIINRLIFGNEGDEGKSTTTSFGS